ncbi:MAG: hypothetical protein B7Z81_04820 [Acidocella sp. 20-61-6]|nr:MAG: hypothetical protein B7Z81_04820 [Acidocella sp. 20-61-6]
MLSRRATAAVEFALMAPFLLVLFIGVIEIVTLYRTEAKLNTMVISVAQMVAIQNQTTTSGISVIPSSGTSQASLQDICQGAILGLAPFPPEGMTLAIAGVTLESSPTGLPNVNTATAQAYTAANTYDAWESDLTVLGTTCNTAATTAIGLTNAEKLATTSPPSTTGTSGTSGLLGVPCDSAIIVKATLTYPGIMGIILTSRPTIAQTVYTRWRYASPQTELQCANTDTGCTTRYATTQLCNSSNTSKN